MCLSEMLTELYVNLFVRKVTTYQPMSLPEATVAEKKKSKRRDEKVMESSLKGTRKLRQENTDNKKVVRISLTLLLE